MGSLTVSLDSIPLSALEMPAPNEERERQLHSINSMRKQTINQLQPLSFIYDTFYEEWREIVHACSVDCE